MRNSIEVGTIVEVFEDPISCHNKEGKAKIVEILGVVSHPVLLGCSVRFEKDDTLYLRNINIYNH